MHWLLRHCPVSCRVHGSLLDRRLWRKKKIRMSNYTKLTVILRRMLCPSFRGFVVIRKNALLIEASFSNALLYKNKTSGEVFMSHGKSWAAWQWVRFANGHTWQPRTQILWEVHVLAVDCCVHSADTASIHPSPKCNGGPACDITIYI